MHLRKLFLSGSSGKDIGLTECLPHQSAQLLLQRRQIRAWLYAPHHVKPPLIRAVYIRRVRQHWHRFNRHVEIRRCAAQSVAIEPGRSNARDRHRLRIHPEGTAYDRRIARIVALPGGVAHQRREGRALHIIGIGQQTPGTRLQAKSPEVIPRNKLAHRRPRTGLVAIAAHRDRPVFEARLYRRQLFELRSVFSQQLPCCSREVAVISFVVAIVLYSSTHAAVVVIADPYQRLRIGYGQVPHQHRVDQREDGRIRSDPQRQRQHRRRRKARSFPQLPQRVAHILNQSRHHLC